MTYDPDEDYTEGKVTSSEKAAAAFIGVIVAVLLVLWKIYRWPAASPSRLAPNGSIDEFRANFTIR